MLCSSTGLMLNKNLTYTMCGDDYAKKLILKIFHYSLAVLGLKAAETPKSFFSLYLKPPAM